MGVNQTKLQEAIERARQLRAQSKVVEELAPKVSAADLCTPEEDAQEAQAAGKELQAAFSDNLHDRKLSPKHEKIVNCLIAGFQQVQIAASLGVSESAVTQEIQAYSLAEIAAARSLHQQNVFNEIDTKYTNTELKLIAQLEKLAPYMTDPVKISVALRTVNAAKRRSMTGEGGSVSDKARVVVLQTNKMIQNTFVFNKANEAIAVDGRPLVSMQTSQLLKRVQERNNAEVQDEEFQRIHQEHGSVLGHL